MNIAVGRPGIQGRKSPSSGSRVIGNRLGETLYNYVAAWTLSSSVALVGLYDYNSALSIDTVLYLCSQAPQYT